MDSANLRCLVVDDEPLAARLISTYVERTPFMTLVAELHAPEAALEFIKDGDIDLVFLDIHMPRLSGMQLARILPDTTRVVFTTAYADHAVEGFRVNAIDYLLKPVSYEDFLEAAMRAQKLFEASSNVVAPVQPTAGFLTVKSEYRLLRIPFDEIIYIEGLKDYVRINTGDDSKPVLTLMSMKSLEEALPATQFMRVHRSFIVNLDRVRLIERNSIILAGRCIPVGDSYRKRFFAYLGGE